LFVSNARHVTAGGDVQNAKSGKRGQTNGQPVYWRDALIRWKPSKGSSAARDGYVTAYRVRNGDVIHLGDSERLRPGPHGRAARAFAIDDPWTDGGLLRDGETPHYSPNFARTGRNRRDC